MKNNVKIAKELIRIAKSLVADNSRNKEKEKYFVDTIKKLKNFLTQKLKNCSISLNFNKIYNSVDICYSFSETVNAENFYQGNLQQLIKDNIIQNNQISRNFSSGLVISINEDYNFNIYYQDIDFDQINYENINQKELNNQVFYIIKHESRDHDYLETIEYKLKNEELKKFIKKYLSKYFNSSEINYLCKQVTSIQVNSKDYRALLQFKDLMVVNDILFKTDPYIEIKNYLHPDKDSISELKTSINNLNKRYSSPYQQWKEQFL